jgi:hypothetical protein
MMKTVHIIGSHAMGRAGRWFSRFAGALQRPGSGLDPIAGS